MERRNLIRLAAIVAVVALFAGKRFLGPDDKGGHVAPPDAGPTIEQKAGERGFTLGSLAFAPCELDQKIPVQPRRRSARRCRFRKTGTSPMAASSI